MEELEAVAYFAEVDDLKHALQESHAHESKWAFDGDPWFAVAQRAYELGARMYRDTRKKEIK